MEASSSLGSSLGLAAKKEAMATPNLKAPELQECPFPVGFVPQKETAAVATASAAPTQAGRQPPALPQLSTAGAYSRGKGRKPLVTAAGWSLLPDTSAPVRSLPTSE